MFLLLEAFILLLLFLRLGSLPLLNRLWGESRLQRVSLYALEEESKVIKKKTCVTLKVSLRETVKNLNRLLSFSFKHFSPAHGLIHRRVLRLRGQMESTLWTVKPCTHARNDHIPDTHTVKTVSLLPLEYCCSHSYFPLRIRDKVAWV